MIKTLACVYISICSTLVGHPHVHDGDTIYFDSNPVRLFGIDAEELSEPNGHVARHALKRIIANEIVTCVPVSTSHHRIVAKCSTPTKVDLSLEMVRRGYALDCARYSQSKYRAYEAPDARIRLTQKPYC